jgi:hypothetical protein
LSGITGGPSTPALVFTLGYGRAVIGGTEFSGFPQNPGLAGTLRFETPAVVVPPVEMIGLLRAPFTFRGDVAGFAPDDLERSG